MASEPLSGANLPLADANIRPVQRRHAAVVNGYAHEFERVWAAVGLGRLVHVVIAFFFWHVGYAGGFHSQSNSENAKLRPKLAMLSLTLRIRQRSLPPLATPRKPRPII